MDYPDFIPSTQMLDSTQSLQEEEETETFNNVTLGTLIVDENSHNITRGTYKIGRDPTQCDIIVNQQIISKFHLIIEEADDNKRATLTLKSQSKRDQTGLDIFEYQC